MRLPVKEKIDYDNIVFYYENKTYTTKYCWYKNNKIVYRYWLSDESVMNMDWGMCQKCFENYSTVVPLKAVVSNTSTDHRASESFVHIHCPNGAGLGVCT